MLICARILGIFSLGVFAIDIPVWISVPSKVVAEVTIQATLEANVHNGDSSFSNSFRVYLASSYEDKAHYFYSSDCYLVREQTLCDASIDISNRDSVNYQQTKFNVTIPASVGPAGRHYVLVAQTLNTDGSYYGSKLESDVFELIAANGTWAAYQEEGNTLWGDDALPCTSFACVKGCVGNSTMQIPTGSDNSFHECANATPSPCSIRNAPSATDATTTEVPTSQVSGPSATTSRRTGTAAESSAAFRRRSQLFAYLSPIAIAMGFLF